MRESCTVLRHGAGLALYRDKLENAFRCEQRLLIKTSVRAEKQGNRRKKIEHTEIYHQTYIDLNCDLVFCSVHNLYAYAFAADVVRRVYSVAEISAT